MNQPVAILEQLDAVRAETLRRLRSLTQSQLDWQPPASQENSEGWSLGELFMHLAIDEHYLREQIVRPLLEGIKPPEGVVYIPPPAPRGLPQEVIQFWFERAREMTRRLVENWPQPANLELRHDGGLVKVFGGPPMNGAEWLEGYGGHEAFHQRQIDSVITLPAEYHIQ